MSAGNMEVMVVQSISHKQEWFGILEHPPHTGSIASIGHRTQGTEAKGDMRALTWRGGNGWMALFKFSK